MSAMRRAARVALPTWLQPAVAGVLVFSAGVAIIGWRLLGLTGGRLVYGLDDPYIHLAIARNLVLHGIWGINPDTFSATSSSPLWTFLVAGMLAIFGTGEWVPLVLNLLFGVLAVLVLARALVDEGLSRGRATAATILAVLIAPLPSMAWIGMEHTLQILLVLLLVAETARAVRADDSASTLPLSVLAAAAVAVRYETLFVIAGCAIVFVLRRQTTRAVILSIAGVAPVVAVGLWNIAHDWFFLPASILLKQTAIGPGGTAPRAAILFAKIETVPLPLAVAMFAVTIAAWRAARRRENPGVWPVVFLVATTLHFVGARFGHHFRYEAYLLVLGAVAIASIAARQWRVSADTFVVGAALATLVFSARTIVPLASTANLAGHIYRQQVHVAAFAHEYLPGSPVAVNDIGAMAFYSGVRLIDLVGLGTREVAALRRAGQWRQSSINDMLAREDVRVAIIYDTWFAGEEAFQNSWVHVADWTTDQETKRGEGTVSFYARDAATASGLRDAMRTFTAAHSMENTKVSLF